MEEKKKRLSKKSLVAIIAATVVVVAAAAVGVVYAVNRGDGFQYVKAENPYGYTNQDPQRAVADDGFSVDGVFDEQVYQDNTWLYLHNENGSSRVDLAMTSYYGEKGMYFAFDSTETTPIYVNPGRASYLNSGIELYLAPDGVTGMNGEENIFEIDLLPTGEVRFKKRVSNDSFANVSSSNDIMAYLGTTLKGGAVNTEECYGYTMEFFIPWDYLKHLGLDVETVKKSHMWVNPVHITSYNYAGTDTAVDRYWYSFATQKGSDGWNDVTKYFRFNEKGVMDTVPVTLVEGEHYTIAGSRSVITNMKAYVTIVPEKGYAISSILCNGEEKIKKVSYKEDGSILAVFKGPEDAKGLTISAAAEKVTEGMKTLRGQVNLKRPGGGDSFEDLWIACIGPKGETQITLDQNGRFELKDLEQGYYTIQAEKKGYYNFSKGIYLNRDIDTDVDIEYEMFVVESGYSWDIEDQSDMQLFQWGGKGAVLSKNSYNSFYIEGNFWYDPEQPSISRDDLHLQQRAGLRVKFSNGMYLHPDLMLENGVMKIQYGKFMGDSSLFNWNTAYTLTESEIAKLKSREGIRFGLLRDGQYVLLYLDGKPVRIEDLGDEYKDCAAQAGFESFSAASYTIKYKFDYVGVKAPDDMIHATNLEEGRIVLPLGGYGAFQLPGSYVTMNLSLKAMDHPDGSGDPRTDVLLKFANGKAISFGIARLPEGVVAIQSTDAGLNAWKSYGNLTEEETVQYQTVAGVLLRVVREGTDFSLYVGDRLVNVVDLTGEIEPGTEMTVTIRHWDDSGARIDIPFDISRDVDQSLPFFLHGQDWETVGTEQGVLISKPQADDKITELRIRERFVDIDLTLTMKETNYPNENRNDIFFKFTNGKTVSFGINSLKNGGGVNIQSTNDSIFGWKVHASLKTAQTAKFREEGVDLRVVRKGTMFYLLLDGRLVNCYDLSEHIGADEEAAVSIRYWGDGGERHEIPFVLSGTVTDETIEDFLDNTGIFVDNAGWDLTREEEGVVSLASGGDGGNLQFRNKFTDMDLTVKVQDHPDGTGEPRTAIFVTFDNGVDIRFSVVNQGRPFVQTMDGTLLVWKSWGDLTAEEVLKYQTAEGIDFRIVRKGTYIYQFIGDRLVAAHNLGGYIQADTGATVSIRHWGDTGVQINIPFVSRDSVADTKVTIEEAENGSVTSEKSVYGFGENVVLNILPDQGYRLKKLTINGEDRTAETAENKLIVTASGEDICVKAEFEKIVSAEVSFRVTGYKLGRKVSLAGRELVFAGSGEKVTAVIGEDGMVTAALSLGSYTISAEGYISTGIEVTADGMVADQILNYNVFEVVSGSWELGSQNDGKTTLNNGGYGEIRFNDKMKDMDLTIKVQKHPDGGSDARAGVVFNFNGKLAAFSVQYNNGRPWVQTMGGNGYITGWKDWYFLNAEETQQYMTAEGIDFRVRRQGAMFYLYIGDKTGPVASFDLSESIGAEDEATVSIRHWDDGGAQIEIPFVLENNVSFKLAGYKLGESVSLAGKQAVISNDAGSVEALIGPDGTVLAGLEPGAYTVTVEGYLPGTVTVEADKTAKDVTLAYDLFKINAGSWELGSQNDGKTTLNNGGYGEICFNDKMKDMDLTIKVQKHPDGGSDARAAVIFNFNGKLAAFSVQYNNGKPWVQTMGGNGYITGWKDWYFLNAEEIQQYMTAEGIDFRVRRQGAMFYLYIGDKTEPVASFDLSESIGAEDEATVSIRHWDDGGAQIEIPFVLENNVSFKLAGYKLGESVSLAGKQAVISNDAGSVEALIGPDGTVLAGLEPGAYTVTVEGYLPGTVTVEADKTVKEVTLAYDVFEVISGSWNLTGQNDGKLSLPGGTGNLRFRDKLTDMDLTVKVQDHPDGTGEPRTGIFVIFDNGVEIRFSVVNQGKPFVQTMDGTLFKWKNWGNLTTAEVAQYETAEGIDYRIVREGTVFYQHIGDRLVAELDLSDYIEADTAATVQIRHWGDTGAQINIPFTLKLSEKTGTEAAALAAVGNAIGRTVSLGTELISGFINA